MTADGLKHLANMRRLDSLTIGDSRITGQGLAHLYPLKTLHIIRINSAIPIGGQAIVRLRTELPHLQALGISRPKPPPRRPRTSKPRARPQAGSAKGKCTESYVDCAEVLKNRCVGHAGYCDCDPYGGAAKMWLK